LFIIYKDIFNIYEGNIILHLFIVSRFIVKSRHYVTQTPEHIPICHEMYIVC